MNKGTIFFYDDDPEITRQFQTLMEDTDFSIIVSNSIDNLRRLLDDQTLMQTVKVLIFDLAKDSQEQGRQKDFEIIKDIKGKFNHYRIPIFIHSAFATSISEFSNCGTVWKIDKSGTSLDFIIETINKLYDSGFIELFTPNGLLEKTLFHDLHKSFTEQFRNGEIDSIIKSLNDENLKERGTAIFKRIAIRSLMSEVLAPSVSDVDGINPIEHYYRRISKIDIWTGDIMIHKVSGESIFILTPRCNIMSDSQILICPIIVGDFPAKKSSVSDALRNKPEISGYNRYLPPSPIFKGGKVMLSRYSLLTREVLIADYKVYITLSDELTNELLGKFGSYFFRTGITPINQEETINYAKQ